MNSKAARPSLISLGMGNKRQELSEKEVIRIEGFGNYSKFIRKDTAPAISSRTLIVYENLLPRFVRIHKRCLVNLAHIQQLEQVRATEAYVLLSTGERLPISRRRIAAISQRVNN